MKVRREDLPSGSVSVLKKIVAAVGNRGKVYIYGGWLRDFALKEMDEDFSLKSTELEDLDIVIVSDEEPFILFDEIFQMFPEDLGGLPHPTSLRLFFDKFKIDLTVTPSLKGKVFDFTVNTFYVSVKDLLEKGESEIRSVHGGFEDLRRKILRIVEGFPLKEFPHHTLRGLRLISVYGLTPTSGTSRSLREAVKVITDQPPYYSLIHQEVAEIIQRSGEKGIDILDEYGFWTAFFPPLSDLKKLKEKDSPLFTNRYEHSIVVTKLLSIFLQDREELPDELRRIVRLSAPKELLERGLAPANRNVLYSYIIASVLHDIMRMYPEHTAKGAMAAASLLSDRGFYPMERFIISMCIYHHHDIHAIVKGEKKPSEVKKLHPLVLSFLIPFTLCDVISWSGDDVESLQPYIEVCHELLE